MTPDRRYDRATLEQLLEGASPRRDELAALLAAARAAATEDELAGLGAALAAFVAAPTRAGNPSAAALGAVRRPRRTRLSSFGVRAAVAAAAGAAVLGGVALADTSGGTPPPLSGHAADAAGPHSSAAPRTSTGSLSGVTTPESDRTGTEPVGTPSGRPTATPSPALAGLCQAWLSRPHQHGAADESAAFRVLIATAGGKDAVTAYCTSVLASSRPSPHNSRHPHSEGAGTDGRPEEHGDKNVPGTTTTPPVSGSGNRSDAFPLPPISQNRPTSLPSAVPGRPVSR